MGCLLLVSSMVEENVIMLVTSMKEVIIIKLF